MNTMIYLRILTEEYIPLSIILFRNKKILSTNTKPIQQNMTKYQVRSKELIDVINEIKNKRLILSPYFQRNLVWRLIHKIDFIKTILLGYPFPQIFIARGTIDIETMSTTSCIVDGQQRMNSILGFIRDEFKVDGRLFSELTSVEKESFLKYQIPIIDLDIDNDNPEVMEIFQRLNRTFYSLSSIEKLSTEYAASEFMLLAKFLTDEVKFPNKSLPDDENEMPLQLNPNISSTFIEWSSGKQVKHFDTLVIESDIFTSYELARQVHLMFTLNVMATIIGDFYNRNETAIRYLEEYSEAFSRKDELFSTLEAAAHKYIRLRLKKKSYWYNKANAFSLLCLFAKNIDKLPNIEEKEIKNKLEIFENNLPADYQLSAKEGVNNKKERLTRNTYLDKLIFKI